MLQAMFELQAWLTYDGTGNSRTDVVQLAQRFRGMGVQGTSYARSELLQKHLRADEVEQKLACAVRQIWLVKQRFDLLSSDNSKDRAIGQQFGTNTGVMHIKEGKDRGIEADLAAIVHDCRWSDASHGLS
jgi:hypothetical protein